MERKKYLESLIFPVLMITITLICAGCGCGQTQQDMQAESTQEQNAALTEDNTAQADNLISAETQQTEKNADLPKDVQQLVDALLATSELDSFTINTNADINLEGNFITGEFLIDSTVAVENNTIAEKNQTSTGDGDNLTMKLRTTSNQDDIVSYAYYQDGWYYTDDKKGKNKLEKKPEEVLPGVTDITAMVIDAASSITDMQVSKDGTDIVYTYSIPADQAEKYFSQVTDKLGETNEQIAGASAQVAEIELISTVDADGYVSTQQVYILGKMKKSIFKIPAEVAVTAEFEQGDQTDFDFPENYDEWK